jgi:hypothetical protein
MLPFIATALPELPPVVQPQSAKTRQQELLEKIMQQAPALATERSFGDCTYIWSQWKLSTDGIRTTFRTCKGESVQTPTSVAVSCPLLQVNTTEAGKWQGWRSPVAKGSKPGEALMVATLCANVAQ